MGGRYGAYVKHGSVNATLPKDKTPEDLTLEEALALLAERAGKSGASLRQGQGIEETRRQEGREEGGQEASGTQGSGQEGCPRCLIASVAAIRECGHDEAATTHPSRKKPSRAERAPSGLPSEKDILEFIATSPVSSASVISHALSASRATTRSASRRCSRTLSARARWTARASVSPAAPRFRPLACSKSPASMMTATPMPCRRNGMQ